MNQPKTVSRTCKACAASFQARASDLKRGALLLPGLRE